MERASGIEGRRYERQKVKVSPIHHGVQISTQDNRIKDSCVKKVDDEGFGTLVSARCKDSNQVKKCQRQHLFQKCQRHEPFHCGMVSESPNSALAAAPRQHWLLGVVKHDVWRRSRAEPAYLAFANEVEVVETRRQAAGSSLTCRRSEIRCRWILSKEKICQTLPVGLYLTVLFSSSPKLNNST